MIILDIPQTWEFVSYVRNEVRQYLPNTFSEELTDSAVMTASELTENAIKYGCSSAGDKTAKIDIDISDNTLSIIISSGITENDNLENLMNSINNINASGDVEALYMSQLQKILDNPSLTVSQLGLLRIAYEAKFTLSYERNDKTIKILAKRAL